MCGDAKSEQNFKNADMEVKTSDPKTAAIKGFLGQIAVISQPKRRMPKIYQSQLNAFV